MEFMFGIPSFVQFGSGVGKKVGEVARSLGAQKVFFVYDQGIKDAGLSACVLDSLQTAGLEVLEYGEVLANPTDIQVEEAAALARKFKAEVTVALGGGSSIDCAKAINILQTNPSPINQYDGLNMVGLPTKPLIAIPTTAGTASEVTAFSIVTDTVRQKKMVIGGQFVGASMALVDPDMTVGMPAALTAATGMDALTHAIEAYVSKNAMVPTDLFALKAIELIYGNLLRATQNGKDMEARSNMLLGSMLAGHAFNCAVLGLVHSIAHPLSVHCGLPHGVANAAGLPFVMEYNAAVAGEKTRDIALAMGLDVAGKSVDEAATAAVDAIKQLSRKLKIPTLGELGVPKEKFDRIAEDALQEISTIFNPRAPSKEDVLAILKQAY
ncbi:MAG: iron-containing alcohol dehydrogenase [Pedobacter sp.]